MSQPTKLIYEGPNEDLEIDVHLESAPIAHGPGSTNWNLRLIAPDPLWKKRHESGEVLQHSSAITSYTTILNRVDGVWGTAGAPSVASGGKIYDILVADDHSVYVGGDFTDYDGVLAADYIARWVDGSGWEAVTSLNGIVHSLATDGTNIYAAGEFTNAGGVANADYVAYWDGSNWNALGNPSSGATITAIYDVFVDNNGDVYVAGDFTNLAGDSNIDYTAVYVRTTGAWDYIDSDALNDICYAIAVDAIGNVYIGGEFDDTAAGALANSRNIVKWSVDDSGWEEMSSGLGVAGKKVEEIALTDSGILYAVGDFTYDGSGSTYLNGVAKWSGSGFEAMDPYELPWVTPVARSVTLTPEGEAIVGGGDTSTNYLAVMVWDGAAWRRTPIQVSGVYYPPTAVATSRLDADNNYDIWIGLDHPGAAGSITFADNQTVTVSGDAPVLPRIEIERFDTDHTDHAWLKLIENYTTGHALRFGDGVDVVPGERVILDIGKGEFYSNFKPNMLKYFSGHSNIGDFALVPGDNHLNTFVEVSTTLSSSDIRVSIIWRDSYWGIDV